MIGKTLAHYEITSQIGKGGMGEVYRARDQKLGRDVAIKVLPPEAIVDPARKTRFVREARAASALNHPNIITVYDMGSDGPQDFIVMEYVAGKTLDQLIGRNGLKLKIALNYAIQITSALAKAHSADIVHRDLKPSNIMVTPDGLVKILDFGLAKLLDRGPKSDEGATTLTADLPVTGEGTIVGTVAYMSPEQAEGRPVDARSDIFSFGSVLYEMLTGHQAFRGDTPVSTLAAIIMKEPAPPGDIAPGLPAEVERAVLRCLRKDPQRRWQTMSDLNVQLNDFKEESESSVLTAARAQPSHGMRARVPVAWFALIVILVGAGAVWWFHRRDKGSTTSRIGPVTSEMERMTFESGIAFWPAISRDGKLIAYSSDRSGSFDIYVRQLNGEAVRRTENNTDDWYPCFSPDGEKIVFRSERNGGGLYLTGALAGSEREIASGGRLASFSPRGSTIAYLVASALTRRGRMFLVDTDSGGQPKPFQQDFVIPPTGASHSPPQWSPDGEHILFQGMRQGDPNSTGWWVAPVAGGEAVRIANMPEQKLLRILVGWWGGYVYYSEGTMIGGMNLYRVPIADGLWRVTGDPERIAAPAGMQYGASASADGRMVFSTLESIPQIWAVGLKANEGTTSGRLQAVTPDAGGKLSLAVAANGSRLAWTAYTLQSQPSRASVSLGIHIIDFIDRREDQIPNGASPQLSADGSRLAYSSGRFAFVTDPGSTSGRQVCENCRIHGFFADASDVLVQYGNQLVRQDVAGEARVALVQPPGGMELFQAAVSPADKWVSFTVARADGTAALYLTPVGKQAAPQEKWIQVAEDPIYLGSPAWSPNGQLLYFASSRDGFICVWAQRIGADGKPKGDPFSVQHNHTAPESTQIGAAWNGITPEKLYMLLFEFTGNLWTLQIKH